MEFNKIKYFTQNNIFINKITCGGYHNISMDRNGKTYAWGSNKYGQCGINKSDINKIETPILINTIPYKITDIKCGEYHTYFKTTQPTKHFLVGYNEYNEVSIENKEEDKILNPHYINDIISEKSSGKHKCINVYLGCCCTVFVLSNKEEMELKSNQDYEIKQKYKFDEKEAEIMENACNVTNALVVCIGIIEYDKNDRKLSSLPSVSNDISNYKNVFEKHYDYKLISSLDKHKNGRMEKKDVIKFIKSCKKEIIDYNDEDNKALFDGLFVTISGHGTSTGLICSDGTEITFDAIRNKFASEDSLQEIPRIFFVDTCRVFADKVQGSRGGGIGGDYSVTILPCKKGEKTIGGKVSKCMSKYFMTEINKNRTFREIFKKAKKEMKTFMLDDYDMKIDDVIFKPNARSAKQGKDKLKVKKESDKNEIIIKMSIILGELILKNRNKKWLVLDACDIENVSEIYQDKKKLRGFKMTYDKNGKDVVEFYGLNSKQADYYHKLITQFKNE